LSHVNGALGTFFSDATMWFVSVTTHYAAVKPSKWDGVSRRTFALERAAHPW
jgi:hypothetical protein